MIYLYYGDDSLSLREALDALKERVQPPEVRDVNISVLETPSFNELQAASSSVPFMADRRLVIVEGLLSKMEGRGKRGADSDGDTPGIGEWTALGDYLGQIPETTDLVFTDGAVRANNPLVVRIKPLAETRQFTVPKGPELHNWIRQRAQEKNTRIHPQAVAALANSVGSDLGVLDAELEKLSLFCWEREIGPQDVDEMVVYTREANVFAIVDAMLENRPGVAFTHISRFLETGNHPLQLMALIGTQVRRLLLTQELRAEGIKPDEIGQRLRMSGYPLQKTVQQEAKLTRPQLVAMHNLLMEADLSLKTSTVDGEIALDLLVADFCTVARRRPAPARR
ncbi:MAG: DNA polymerase III subunit delta [Chloroflexi bacterium]|nr:DNA polymerase III subunit delta [Chloroflexota bacterium]